MKQYKIQIPLNSLFPWLYSPLYDQKVWIMYITRDQNAHIWKFNSLKVFIAQVQVKTHYFVEKMIFSWCFLYCVSLTVLMMAGCLLPIIEGRPPDIDTSSAWVSSYPPSILRYHLYSGCVTKPREQHWYCWLWGCEREHKHNQTLIYWCI